MLSRTINARGDLVITADAEGREEVIAETIDRLREALRGRCPVCRGAD